MSSRKSGLKKINDLLNLDEALDLSEFIEPYLTFQQEYGHILTKDIKEKAFLVTFKNDPSLVYIAFEENKDKAKGMATKYFRDSFYPTFMGSEWKKRYKETRTKRMKSWDIYYKSKKVPVVELMKIGASFPCCSCKKYNFTYSDYESKRCVILEDEVDTNVFTKGIVLCYDCFKKLCKN